MTHTPELFVVGSLNMDLVATAKRLPAPGETVAGGVLVRQPGGTGGNQAAAAARLGARVRMVGAVGDDADGREILESLQAAGVDTSAMQRSAARTGCALVLVDAAGENSILVCAGANDDLDAAAAPLPDDAAVLMQLEVPLATAVQIAKRPHGFLALNASPAVTLPAELLAADLIIVNETEFEALPELRDARLVAVTLGARGAVLRAAGEVVATATSRRASVVSTVGAGDAFAAALTVGLLQGLDRQRALEIACEVGASAVEDARSQPPLKPLQHYARQP